MSDEMKTAIAGFIAGVLSALIFHQGAVWIASQFGWARLWTGSEIGVQCLWSGLWGVLAVFAVERLPGNLKGWPGWVLVVIALSVIEGLFGSRISLSYFAINAIWGFGTWLIVKLERKAFGWP
jgi:hypothetical protein